jgi:hypothetical protein
MPRAARERVNRRSRSLGWVARAAWTPAVACTDLADTAGLAQNTSISAATALQSIVASVKTGGYLRRNRGQAPVAERDRTAGWACRLIAGDALPMTSLAALTTC